MNISEAVTLLPFIKAFSEGKNIQVYDRYYGWVDVGNEILNINRTYRISSEKTLIPFNLDDRELLRDKWVKKKNDTHEIKITYIDYIGVNDITYKELLDEYVFIDGEPCGKYVEE